MDFDAENAPSDVIEVDVAGSSVDEIAVEGRFLEVVNGTDSDPLGTLVVKLVGSYGAYRTLTNLEVGWEHPMQIVGIRKTGSTVTTVRVWK